MPVLHEIEKKIIASLEGGRACSPEDLGGRTGLGPDQVRRGIQWLRLKEMVRVDKKPARYVVFGPHGSEAAKSGLPERRLLDLVGRGTADIAGLQKAMGPAFGPAMGIARKNGWLQVQGSAVSLADAPKAIAAEDLLSQVSSGEVRADRQAEELAASRPGLFDIQDRPSEAVTLLDAGRAAGASAQGSGSAIDVEAAVGRAYPARRHPLSETIREIREAFVALGFEEVAGSMVQPGFWNFDALFTPQDHPAREMHDTFYLDGAKPGRFATPQQERAVAASHKRGWNYEWSAAEARRTVLRTHTTCVTIRHLAEQKPDDARVFSLGRVFRNEKASYKHLVEFHQVEGIIIGRRATLRDLMGIQREFYRRIGLDQVKFWPTFFPYTEPSMQAMVYNSRLKKWVEMFGMGIFRPEVTRPLGIRQPVLAWGGGIERIAMLKYAVDDVRQFYANSLEWLRSARPCQ